MPWWGWMVTGTLLFGAEMLGVSAQFYLVFLGAAALVVGLLGVAGVVLPEWLQWITFAAVALVCMALFRARLYDKFKGADGAVEERLILGDRIAIPERLAPGASCRVEYRGTTWSARNTDTQTIEAGVEAEIWETTGLTLHLRNPR
jgi:membrane protein implicated in regulation of membrane protease activity